MSEPIVPGRLSPTSEESPTYRRASDSGGGGRVLFMIFFLLFLVAGLIALGWLVWQQQQTMQQMSQQLTEAHTQVTSLSAQLSDTESNMTATARSADEQISVNESEIRKLWDVSNKRNKTWIQTNQGNIATIKGDIKQVKDTLQQTETDIGATMAQVLRQQRDVSDQVNLISQRFNQLQDNVVNQVNENSQSIGAIDASRVQNNQRILDVSRRLGNVEQQLRAIEGR